MSLPNLNTTATIESEYETTRPGNAPRRSTYFFDLGHDVATPLCRQKFRSASQVGSPDSPLTSSDSDAFQADSPTIRLLDPAHRPSPRSIQALRRDHPPLVVITDDHHDRINRLCSPASRPAWRNLRSASSIESFSSRFTFGTHPLTSTPYRGSYVEIGGDDLLSRKRLWLKRFAVIAGTIVVVLIVSAAPSIVLTRRLIDAENYDLFTFLTERPDIVIPAW